MSSLTVKDVAGVSYPVSTDNSGKYFVTMPAAHVTVTVTFSRISSATADSSNPKTGDTGSIGIWSSAMLMSALGLILILEDNRRKLRK